MRPPQVAHFKLAYSRAFFLRAYPRRTHEMLFDAHNHAFRVLSGVPRRGVYDNMRTAVDTVGRGKERQVNARFSAKPLPVRGRVLQSGLRLGEGADLANLFLHYAFDLWMRRRAANHEHWRNKRALLYAVGNCNFVVDQI
jgi:hypothetical protein